MLHIVMKKWMRDTSYAHFRIKRQPFWTEIPCRQAGQVLPND